MGLYMAYFLLLGSSCGSVNWGKCSSNKGAWLGLYYGKVIGGTLISVERLPLGLYDVIL